MGERGDCPRLHRGPAHPPDDAADAGNAQGGDSVRHRAGDLDGGEGVAV